MMIALIDDSILITCLHLPWPCYDSYYTLFLKRFLDLLCKFYCHFMNCENVFYMGVFFISVGCF